MSQKSVYSFYSLSLITLLCLSNAQAIEITETAFELTRTTEFANPYAAHFNSVDGLVYLARRGAGSEDGLYRINADGTTTKLADGSNPSGVVADPDGGDVFFAEDFGGNIYRVPFGGTGRSVWVSGFHAGDDDPFGLAIATNSYAGTVISPGDAVVVDRGVSGPDEVWRFSPDTPEGEVRLHTDDGTLVDALDITVGSVDIHLVDDRGSAAGIIYRLNEDGSLTEVPQSEPLPEPVGIAADPLTDRLFVLDGTQNRLVRFNTVTGNSTEVFSGFEGPGATGVDVSPDGSLLVITDRVAGLVYEFTRDAENLSIETESAHFVGLDLGFAFEHQFEAILGTPPFTWSISAGTPPPGLSMAANGVLSGIPNQPGTFSFTVRATDDIGATDDKVFEVTLTGPSTVEAGWTLTRAVAFGGPRGAHFNPIDGLLYVARDLDTSADGLYRINADGTSTQIGTVRRPLAVAVDHEDGDIYLSKSVFNGTVFRVPFGGTGLSTWVSGFDVGDEDMFGMAFAPSSYTGTLLNPGDGLVVDFGQNNTKGIWRFSSSTPEGETAVHIGAPLVSAVDVTIGTTEVFVADQAVVGGVHRVEPDGSLTPVLAPVVQAQGIATDPITQDLLVLDGATAQRLIRFAPDTGVSNDVVTGFEGVAAASVDVSPDGAQLFVTDRAAGRIGRIS